MEKYIITMLGEKDHGKSTLIGNLLIATGSYHRGEDKRGKEDKQIKEVRACAYT